jgi:hypothetical protein
MTSFQPSIATPVKSFAAIHEETQMDARAELRRIDTSPEACKARIERLSKAAEARAHRIVRLGDARAIYRSYLVNTDRELLQALQNIHSSLGFESQRTETLMRLIEALDDDVQDLPEPEILGCDKRGEFDGRTVGVRGRA